MDEIESTKDVLIPSKPMERIIGQDAAVAKVILAVKQRRHLLVVGPPGIGKSMLAKTLADQIPRPNEQVNIIHSPKDPHRPYVEILNRKALEKEKESLSNGCGRIVSSREVPGFVTERLGFRCSMCGVLSSAKEETCPSCGTNKYRRTLQDRKKSPFGDVITEIFEFCVGEPESEIQTTQTNKEGEEELVVYQRLSDGNIRILNQQDMLSLQKRQDRRRKNVLIPLNRKTFIHATGASETELLGDVRHDPYGGHPDIGTPAYLRVVQGAIHEAHEGVLFIDELPHLEHLQNFILTAMQDKVFPIVGRNPQSAGASVKVVDVPCDFLFVGACNIRDIEKILPPLRSRILGNGYEILLETTMPDTPENRKRIYQFVAQEIESDGRIPHATSDAVKEIIEEAVKRANDVDNVRNALTLRLRDLGGVVRVGGDFAIHEGSEFIEREHIKRSVVESRAIEHQLRDRYGSLWKAYEKDDVVGMKGDDSQGYR